MLYSANDSRDNCGFGLIADPSGTCSHELLQRSLEALNALLHRGGIAADGKTGDGCGLLIRFNPDYFRLKAKQQHKILPKRFAIAMVFLSKNPEQQKVQQQAFERIFKNNDLSIRYWRAVPVNENVLGYIAKQNPPAIYQAFIDTSKLEPALEMAKLYIVRRQVETALEDQEDVYICSCSSKTVLYKGLMLPQDISRFFLDLQEPEFEASVCVFHQRFSTNTQPKWPLAQPFRYLAHNGEINTIRGNRQWAKARLPILQTPLLPSIKDLGQVVSETGSDSQSLDNMLEYLIAGGMNLCKALRLMIPPAWQNVEIIDPNLRAFYEYLSMHMEPWDGPAGIVLTDGDVAVCALDRNGLRPTRWVKTHNGWITIASEIGVWGYKPDEILAMGRVRPGDIFAIDLVNHSIFSADDIDQSLAKNNPYREWLRDHSIRIESRMEAIKTVDKFLSPQQLAVHEQLHLVSFEEKKTLLKTLAVKGQEATGSMGDDTPLAVLSSQERLISDYFRQQFAQVTNPPIDSLRESIVMSLETCIGPEQNAFEESSSHARRILLMTPVLSTVKYQAILQRRDQGFAYTQLSLGLCPNVSLQQGLEALVIQVQAAVAEGTVLIILSDKRIEPQQKVIPAVLAVGYLHQIFSQQGLRCHINLLVETGQARDPHQFAVLLGVGATAIYPWLSYDLINAQCSKGEINLDPFIAFKLYRQGIRKGIYKVLSKMGISTIASYRGAQLFEVLGLSQDVSKACFPAMPNPLGGMSFDDIDQQLVQQSAKAWGSSHSFRAAGSIKYMYGGEYHCFNPEVVNRLQHFIKSDRFEDYESYRRLIDQRPVTHLRDLLEYQVIDQNKALDLDEIESLEAIFPRFDTAAMSLGALSPEAHEALAEAMNQLGGRSNSGEGGEDPARYNSLKNSKIKQIASGRFGVTAEYLVNAEVLQIKIAQGAKPGEGGQLPGAKVNELIAKLRYANPGVTLISPPPHHDIYSIEDLAQLIYDLKEVNPKALVSVKLVSSSGVGTIAAGVAKAGANLITISGYDGGTAASPISSIKHAGSAWEIGLVEAHQALTANGFRDQVTLQVDGGLKSGLDIIKATILGADTFGFGTAPMVALGCKYLRICHLNNCATGVATQDQHLRQHYYQGVVDEVMRFFTCLAEDVRQHLQRLGVDSLSHLRGKTHYLTIKAQAASLPKHQQLDVYKLLEPAVVAQFPVHISKKKTTLSMNDRMEKEAAKYIEQAKSHKFIYKIKNSDRSVGARTSGYIAKQWGNHGLSATPLTFEFVGHAGQSFGAWNVMGQNLHLTGAANDYVGKGMTGGEVIICPFRFDYERPSYQTALIGNTCLYGATGGFMYVAGRAGERFAVRNSGTIAVIEGAGDHCCEYMTRGVVVVLGETGYNFGAGMTGGLAYVLDLDRRFVDKYNRELVDILRITNEETEAHRYHLRELLREHVVKTQSPWGQELLQDFERFLPNFWLVKPKAANLSTLLETTRDRPE
jgi:glutamate synthase (NADPH/NADH) large chain